MEEIAKIPKTAPQAIAHKGPLAQIPKPTAPIQNIKNLTLPLTCFIFPLRFSCPMRVPVRNNITDAILALCRRKLLSPQGPRCGQLNEAKGSDAPLGEYPRHRYGSSWSSRPTAPLYPPTRVHCRARNNQAVVPQPRQLFHPRISSFELRLPREKAARVEGCLPGAGTRVGPPTRRH